MLATIMNISVLTTRMLWRFNQLSNTCQHTEQQTMPRNIKHAVFQVLCATQTVANNNDLHTRSASHIAFVLRCNAHTQSDGCARCASIYCSHCVHSEGAEIGCACLQRCAGRPTRWSAQPSSIVIAHGVGLPRALLLTYPV